MPESRNDHLFRKNYNIGTQAYVVHSIIQGFIMFQLYSYKQMKKMNFTGKGEAMKFKNPLLSVKDIEISKQFYKNVLGLHVIMDFGANITLTGGISLQTEETWGTFIGQKVQYGNGTELYFEEDNFDEFLKKLDTLPIQYIHPVKEQNWGQRVIRILDPDKHIIEIGENIKAVCKRFQQSDMSQEEIAKRMDVPLSYVQRMLR